MLLVLLLILEIPDIYPKEISYDTKSLGREILHSSVSSVRDSARLSPLSRLEDWELRLRPMLMENETASN